MVLIIQDTRVKIKSNCKRHYGMCHLKKKKLCCVWGTLRRLHKEEAEISNKGLAYSQQKKSYNKIWCKDDPLKA